MSGDKLTGAECYVTFNFSAIAARELKKQGRPLKTFAVGLHADTPDLKAARRVAEFLGTDHSEVYFTVEASFGSICKYLPSSRKALFC